MSNTQEKKATAVAIVEPLRIPYPVAAANHGIDEGQWNALVTAIYPTAKTAQGVMLALSYCKARNLDPFKHPVHIVPLNTKMKTAEGKEYWGNIETVWPGINELRITAFRTGSYGGCDPANFGPDVTSEWEMANQEEDEHPNAPPKEKKAPAVKKTMKLVHPEWCQVTLYRLIEGSRIAFPGPRVYWKEAYATISKYSDMPNQMWQDRARGQLEKCAEAAALRKAFPEEIGSGYTIDEAPRMVDVTPAAPEAKPDRAEIDVKPKASTAKRQDAAPDATAQTSARTIEHDTARDEGPKQEETTVMSEALEHSLQVLPKLTADEIQGARQSLRRELSKDDFVVWNTAAMNREMELRGRK